MRFRAFVVRKLSAFTHFVQFALHSTRSSSKGSSAGSLIGWNGVTSTLCAAPSAINSAIASPELEDAPDIVSGSDIEPLAAWDFAYQRQAVMCDRTETGLPHQNPFWAEDRRQ